ncbi:methyltransferase domain-containing protein [Glaciecola sp. MF2-115]|uniref:methyltransferase domain-containing protein n=1 Tax=Glaciecola sp. MF2-115 TaxID=3384827 RepID=UPI0039A22B2C
MNLLSEDVILHDVLPADTASSADSDVDFNEHKKDSADVLNTLEAGSRSANSNHKTLNDTQTLNKHQVADHFSAASASYDQYAQVQKQIAEVNLELLQQSNLSNAKQAVDLGCGTGIHTKSLAALSERCLAIDISHGMLTAARALNLNSKTAQDNAIQYCNGDADNLPLSSGSIDVLHSSMALQWCSSPESATHEIVRVLSNNASAQLAIMLDSSLGELKNAWKTIGLEPRVNEFFGKEQWLNATQEVVNKQRKVDSKTQFTIEHQTRRFVEYHKSSLHMLRALKKIGAATKTEGETHEDMQQRNPFNSSEQECTKSTSKPISKHELKLLDNEMRKQLDENASKNAHINNENQLTKNLPLTYQILFLNIQKHTRSEAK